MSFANIGTSLWNCGYLIPVVLSFVILALTEKTGEVPFLMSPYTKMHWQESTAILAYPLHTSLCAPLEDTSTLLWHQH